MKPEEEALPQTPVISKSDERSVDSEPDSHNLTTYSVSNYGGSDDGDNPLMSPNSPQASINSDHNSNVFSKIFRLVCSETVLLFLSLIRVGTSPPSRRNLVLTIKTNFLEPDYILNRMNASSVGSNTTAGWTCITLLPRRQNIWRKS